MKRCKYYYKKIIQLTKLNEISCTKRDFERNLKKLFEILTQSQTKLTQKSKCFEQLQLNTINFKDFLSIILYLQYIPKTNIAISLNTDILIPGKSNYI